MDEKLRKSLTAIICDTVECTEPLDCDMAKTCPYVIDGLPQIEQAFRDAGWIEPQQPGIGGIGEDELLDKFEHRMEFELLLNATQTAHARQILSDLMDTLEPQQPEGELVNACQGCAYGQSRVCSEADKSDCARWDLAKAQLAQDKARMASPELVHELRVEIAELADKAQNIKDAMATMVKLPSLKDVYPILASKVACNQYDDAIIDGEHYPNYNAYLVAKELLLRLLGEKP